MLWNTGLVRWLNLHNQLLFWRSTSLCRKKKCALKITILRNVWPLTIVFEMWARIMFFIFVWYVHTYQIFFCLQESFINFDTLYEFNIHAHFLTSILEYFKVTWSTVLISLAITMKSNFAQKEQCLLYNTLPL